MYIKYWHQLRSDWARTKQNTPGFDSSPNIRVHLGDLNLASTPFQMAPYLTKAQERTYLQSAKSKDCNRDRTHAESMLDFSKRIGQVDCQFHVE
jgi:hypothetical protein